MDKIKSCLLQKKGIRLIKPNNNICNSYMLKSEESLEMVFIANNTWKIISSYYACYDILYALFQKTGIKCEIHDCSVELMKLFDLNEDDIIFMKELKQERILAQYYINKDVKEIDVSKVKSFVLTIKEKILNLQENDIKNIKTMIKKYQ